MGIKPFQSHSSLSQQNNDYLYYSTMPHVNSQRVHISQIQQTQFSTLSNSPKVIYDSPQRLNDQYLQKQHILSSSGEDLDTLNEYIFFLKSNAPNMDLTNLYTPVHIRSRTQGMCEQAQTTELFYPIYEYRLRAQMQTRLDRGESFHESQVWYVIINVLNALRQFERIKCISIQFDIDSVRFNTDGQLKVNSIVSQPKTLEKLRNERMYWSHKNTVDYYAEETYRFGIVLLEICTFRNFNSSNDYYRIQEGLEIVGNKYSQLLQTLISVMLCHRQDRPLPSQIYHVFAPHKSQIMNFKPFHLQNNISQANSRLSNLHLSNATNQQVRTQNMQNYEDMWTSNNFDNNYQNGMNKFQNNGNKNQNRVSNGKNNLSYNGYDRDNNDNGYVKIEDGYNYDDWRGSQGHARSAHSNTNNISNYKNNKPYGHQSSVSNHQYDNQIMQNYNTNPHFAATTSPYSQPRNTSYNYNTFSESQGIGNFANSIHSSKAQGRNGSLQNSRHPYPASYPNINDARGYSTSNQQMPVNFANTREQSSGGGPSKQRSFAPIESDYYYRY